MLKVSEGTVAAVTEKAYQQEPEDFTKDFLAQLRLENKAVHELTEVLLDRFTTELAGQGAEVEVVKCVSNKEEVFEFIIGKNRERKAAAEKARHLATALLGLVYKSLKAEIEARDLEYPGTAD